MHKVSDFYRYKHQQPLAEHLAHLVSAFMLTTMKHF
jgi:hypothetical protein